MIRNRAAALRLCLLAAAATSCSDSSGPSTPRFEGRYVLVAASNAALPHTLYAGLGPPTQLVSGSLTTMSRGRVMDVRELRAGTAVVHDSSIFAYTVEGNRLVLQRPRINPAQTHADTGTVSSDAVIVRVRYVVNGDATPTSATLVYQRAP